MLSNKGLKKWGYVAHIGQCWSERFRSDRVKLSGAGEGDRTLLGPINSTTFGSSMPCKEESNALYPNAIRWAVLPCSTVASALIARRFNILKRRRSNTVALIIDVITSTNFSLFLNDNDSFLRSFKLAPARPRYSPPLLPAKRFQATRKG